MIVTFSHQNPSSSLMYIDTDAEFRGTKDIVPALALNSR